MLNWDLGPQLHHRTFPMPNTQIVEPGKVRVYNKLTVPHVPGSVHWRLVMFAKKVNKNYCVDKAIKQHATHKDRYYPQLCGEYEVSWICPHEQVPKFAMVTIACDHIRKKKSDEGEAPAEAEMLREQEEAQVRFERSVSVITPELVPWPSKQVVREADGSESTFVAMEAGRFESDSFSDSESTDRSYESYDQNQTYLDSFDLGVEQVNPLAFDFLGLDASRPFLMSNGI